MSATNYRTWTHRPLALYNTSTGAEQSRPRAGTASSRTDRNDGVLPRREEHRVQPRGHGRRAHARDDRLRTSNDTFSSLARPRERPATRSRGRPSPPTARGSSTTRGRTPPSRPTTAPRATSTWSTSRPHTRPVSTRSTATRPSGQTYLPANDPGLSFAPTVLPEAVGGYFWVVFTSHRSYGNTLAVAGQRRPERQALGRGDGPRRDARARTRATPRSTSTARSRRRQPPRLLGAEAVPGGRHGVHRRATNAAAGIAEEGRPAASSACRPPPPKTAARPARRTSRSAAPAADCCNVQDECINSLCAEPAPK